MNKSRKRLVISALLVAAAFLSGLCIQVRAYKACPSGAEGPKPGETPPLVALSAQNGMENLFKLVPGAVDRPDMDRDPGLYFMLADQAAAEGDMETVLFYYRKALSLDPSSAYLHTRLADILARRRLVADAMILARMAALFDPKYEGAYAIQGRIFKTTGDLDRAIEAYYRALELDPDSKDLYIFLGFLQATEKKYDDAENTFKKMVEHFPDDSEGYFYLGKVYIETDQTDKAVELFSKLLERDPDSAAQVHAELGNVLARQKKYDKAEEHLREAVRFDPFNVNAQLGLARVLASQKKFDESYKVFEKLSEIAPSDQSIRIRMALILAAQKQFDKATEILNTILKTKPGWDQVRFHLGRVLREQGKIAEAEKEFVQIQKNSPVFVDSRLALSLMFLKDRQLGKAIVYINEAIEADSKDVDFHQIKASILEELNRFQEALDSYRKAQELDPKNTKMRYSIGNVYEKSGRRGKGMEEMTNLLKEKPDDAGALNFIGYTLLVVGQDQDRAEELIQKAIKLKPDDGYIMDSVGWMLLRKGKIDEALDYLQKSAAKVKYDPIIADHLGDALQLKGKKQEAAESYRRSLKFNPDNLVVQEKLRKLEEELKSQPD